MFFIFGFATRDENITTGEFNCPNCCSPRTYITFKRVNYFRLFFINIFPIEKLGEHVKCRGCGSWFDLDVLKSKPLSPEDKIKLNTWQALTSGMSVQSVITKLTVEGHSKEQAIDLIDSLTRSDYKICKDCKVQYIKDIRSCSICGQRI